MDKKNKTTVPEPKAAEQPQPDYKAEIQKLTENLNNEKALRTQLLADYVNFRKHTAQEKDDLNVTANKMFLYQVIDIIDDFDRAIHLEKDKISPDNDFFQGVALIYKKLTNLLANYKLAEIPVQADTVFDPATMEAVATAPVTDPEKINKVIQVMGRGYSYQDSGMVFKPARVVIGKK